MPEYRRLGAPGAQFFFTLATHERRPILASPEAISCLRAAFAQEKHHHPFEIDGIVIMPDHVHTIWTLPPGDAQFSMRWTKIKGVFTSTFLAAGGSEGLQSTSRISRGERGVWQRRFWEHVIRDAREYEAFMDYIHWNPVKYVHATCPHAWPHSSFHKWVRAGRYAADWMCTCGRAAPPPLDFSPIDRFVVD